MKVRKKEIQTKRKMGQTVMRQETRIHDMKMKQAQWEKEKQKQKGQRWLIKQGTKWMRKRKAKAGNEPSKTMMDQMKELMRNK